MPIRLSRLRHGSQKLTRLSRAQAQTEGAARCGKIEHRIAIPCRNLLTVIGHCYKNKAFCPKLRPSNCFKAAWGIRRFPFCSAAKTFGVTSSSGEKATTHELQR